MKLRPGAAASGILSDMPRVPPLETQELAADVKAAGEAHVREHGARLTNMKRTLLRSVPAFRALMEWYALRDTVQPVLGERLTTLFAHAISTETDCLICSTFFRRILIDWREDPDHLALDDRDEAVVAFGRALARSPHYVTDAVYAPLTQYFTEQQIVAITAFGAIMVATNVFNNALAVPLDDELERYRRTPVSAAHQARQ